MDTNIENVYYNKYIKYKTKYLKLKELRGGAEFCHNNYKILDVGRIVDLNNTNSNFFDHYDIRNINNKYKENINKIYNELKIMLKDFIKSFKSIFSIFNTTSNNLIIIDKKIDEINQKYNNFIFYYSKNYLQENLKTYEQSNNEVIIFTKMLNNNITLIKESENVINKVIEKINNKEKLKDLIQKINSYFEKIDKGLKCSKPIIKVTNLVTSQTQHLSQKPQQPQYLFQKPQQPQYLPQKPQQLPRKTSPEPPPRNKENISKNLLRQKEEEEEKKVIINGVPEPPPRLKKNLS